MRILRKDLHVNPAHIHHSIKPHTCPIVKAARIPAILECPVNKHMFIIVSSLRVRVFLKELVSKGLSSYAGNASTYFVVCVEVLVLLVGDVIRYLDSF